MAYQTRLSRKFFQICTGSTDPPVNDQGYNTKRILILIMTLYYHIINISLQDK